MSRQLSKPILIVFFGALFALLNATFIVDKRQQALILQLGKLQRTLQKPGLYFKWPLIQEVIKYDNRILTIPIPYAEVTLGDQKRAVVDTFLRYRIKNPELFYKTLFEEGSAEVRLRGLVSGVLRSTLGTYELVDLLSKKRTVIMEKIRYQTNEAMHPLGIDVVDVRIRRTDLPQQNNLAIFNRIKSERRKEAVEIRAQGHERKKVIEADAHLEGGLLMAKAMEEAAILRSDGHKMAQTIYREAYSKDPEFARLYQSLEAAKKALQREGTYVLTPDHPLLSYFQRPDTKLGKSKTMKSAP